jgi:histidinol-phosphate/aromatic aminotransferase/cobyric acid decarboxylase-like protein
MITITNTSNLTDVAWIVMGIWAAVMILKEVLAFIDELFDKKNYWRTQWDRISLERSRLEEELRKLKGEED